VSDRDSIFSDAADEARREHYGEVEWFCLRCMVAFDTTRADGEHYDYHLDEVIEPPPCPQCGSRTAVELVAAMDEFIPECACGVEYDPADEARWETADMTDPVCPACIRAWTEAGGGYHICSGCDEVMLHPEALQPEAHGHDRVQVKLLPDGSVNLQSYPCGQWQRVVEVPR
jgi:hypothetical protein